MKMVVAIVQNADRDNLSSALSEANIPHTRLNTTGGFLRAGNTTLVIGIDDDKVQHVLGIIEKACKEREALHRPGHGALHADAYAAPAKVLIGGATIFVLNLDQFQKI